MVPDMVMDKFKNNKIVQLLKKKFLSFDRYMLYGDASESGQEKKYANVKYGLLIAFIISAVVYYSIFLFISTPMGQISWEIQDPLVSEANFVPNHNIIRYELFENGNFLWSNLRGGGLPILGNEIQAGPMFPLFLLTFWLPALYFWNIFVGIRLILTALAAFLIGREALKFSRLSSLCFMFNLVFSIYVLRWMNHPWTNGLMAGLWYLYVLAMLPDLSSIKYGLKRFAGILGLCLTSYSMVTCGFPEASVMSALLVLFIYPFIVYERYKNGKIKIRAFLFDLFIGHLLGFALSSPQIFDILQMIAGATNLTNPDLEFRARIGLAQYPMSMLWTFIFGKITCFSDGPPPEPIIHAFGLIPVTLFILGIFKLLRRPKALNGFDIAAFITLAFFIIKNFPLWPGFNNFIGSLPILETCWFGIYFYTYVLWFFAYFAAQGVSLLQECWANGKKNEALAYLVAAFILVVIALLYLAPIIGGKQYFALLVNKGDYTTLKVLVIFLAFFVTVFFIFIKNFQENKRRRLVLLLFALMVVELFVTRPGEFQNRRNYFSRKSPQVEGQLINDLLVENHINRFDTRVRDKCGTYISSGIATIDIGAPAILPIRLQRFRLALFKTDLEEYFRGALPIHGLKQPYAWGLTSTGLFTDIHGYEKGPDYQVLGNLDRTRRLYYNDGALSRAWVPSRCLPSDGLDTSIKKITDTGEFALGDAYLENMTVAELDLCRNHSSSIKAVPIMEDKGSEVILEEVSGPTVVVLNDNFYPGWTAYDRDTGQNFEIRPANIAFRALILPEKRKYGITFVYRPPWLDRSLLLIGLAIFTIFVLGGLAWRNNKRVITE